MTVQNPSLSCRFEVRPALWGSLVIVGDGSTVCLVPKNPTWSEDGKQESTPGRRISSSAPKESRMNLSCKAGGARGVSRPTRSVTETPPVPLPRPHSAGGANFNSLRVVQNVGYRAVLGGELSADAPAGSCLSAPLPWIAICLPPTFLWGTAPKAGPDPGPEDASCSVESVV